MKPAILVDMNLSPDWVPFLQSHGYSVVHWSHVGDIHALDSELMAWASTNAHVLLTHDLDFGAILALSYATSPSVVLIRAQEPSPNLVGKAVVMALQQCAPELQAGALVVVDAAQHRIRILPI